MTMEKTGPQAKSEKPLRTRMPCATKLLVALALIKLLAHCATNFQYGFFRDELYYIQWSKHLAWGYVEQPPFTALAILLTRMTLGDSLFALRFLPAVCGAVIVLLAGLMAWEMGGGRFAQGMAALSVLIGPTFLGNHALMTINVFDQFFWVVCAYVLIRLIRTGNPTLWLWFGLFAGLGLMNKLTMPFFGAAVIGALLLTPHRRFFLQREIWLGGVIALALFTPYLVWLATHNWASLDWMINYGSGSKTAQASFLSWLYMQVITVHPFTLPIWLSGLYFCFLTTDGRPYRVLGWIFIILYAVFFLLKAKFYFLSPAFPMILAAGSVHVERWYNKKQPRWLKPAYISALVAGGLLSAPLALPVLPPKALVKYLAPLGGNAGIKMEQLEEAELPQHFADQFGWETMVERVAEVYNSLGPYDKAQCAIFASNYGEAAAVDFYGPAYGLPRAISGHNTYHLWGPGDSSGQVLIAILSESDEGMLKELYDEVVTAGRNDCELCMPHERQKVFFLCKGLKVSLEAVWPQLKGYG